MNLWRFILAIVVFLIFLLLKGIFRGFILGLLRKVTSKIKAADKVIDALQPCFEFIFVIAGIWLAFSILGAEEVFLYINKIVRGLLVFVAAWAVYRGLDVVVYLLRERASESDTMLDNYLIDFSGKILKIVVVAVGTVMVLQEWGFNVTTLIAGLGVGGVAIALAGQDFVSNLFGFLTIFIDRAFAIGDYIVTDETEGFVEDIGMRSVKIRTLDRSLVTVPNSAIASGVIVNWTEAKTRRFNFTIGVTYSSTADEIVALTESFKTMLAEHPDIDETDIWVYLSEFGASSIDILLNFFTNKTVNPKEYQAIKHDINLRIMGIIEEHNMSMAFPSRSIYFENLDTQGLKLLDDMKNKKSG